MCGICGIFGTEKLADPRESVIKMTEAMAHRGPDADGVYAVDNVILGHRRLSIIDTSSAGNQPFVSSDGNLALVFNGEIYNYLELKKDLADYPYKSGTDTEVVLAAYLKWGIGCIRHFNGFFAFALHDKLNGVMYVVRDRHGIKPLYYTSKGSTLAFASEIRALIKAGLAESKLDTNALADYLRYQTVHAPATILQGVKLLEAGCYLELTDDNFALNRFWSPAENYRKDVIGMSALDAHEAIRETLTDSVRLRLRADVPFGAFLSGGIDSSILVGLMAQESPHRVKTFSVTFGEKEFDESPYSAAIAERFNTEHREIRLTANDFLQFIPAALSAVDHPGGDGPNSWVVSKLTKEAGVTMAISGLGGDELFAGYDIFKQSMTVRDRKWIYSFPKSLRVLSARAYGLLNPGIKADKLIELMGMDYGDFEYFYPLSRKLFTDSRIGKLLHTERLPANVVFRRVKDTVSFGSPGFGLPHLSKVSVAEMETYMRHTLLRDADQMSMAHALEVRVPFLDHRLTELVLGLSDEIKFPHTTKKLLVNSFPSLLPDDVVKRPKMGFTFPWRHWMKNELRELCETAIDDLSRRPEFESSEVKKVLRDFMNDHPSVTWSRLWPLVTLSNWLSSNKIG